MNVGTDAGDGIINVYQAGNGWQETTINGANKPTKLSNTPIATLNSPYALNNSYVFDVETSDFSEDQITFVLEMADGNDVSFASKESNVAAGPKLTLKINDVTAINKNEVESLFKIFPNPANDILNIEGELEAWKIFDVSGKTIYTGDTKFIDISSIEKGLYILEINTTERQLFIKE